MSQGGTPNHSRRGSVVTAGATDVSGNPVKKFLNGWTKEQERLMAEWADVAGCYRWLHDRAEKIFSGANMWITIPVIVLSTLTGTANFAVGSFIPEGDQELKKYVGAGIGGISIFAGILTTLGNFFQYAQKSEAHKVAGVAWGKFQRQVAVELAIHPDERIDAMDFLKICRQDLDRLIEQSPPIPDSVILAFEKEFKDIKDLKVPDICHGIEHTRVYDASKPRMAKLGAEAAMFLRQKKAALARELIPAVEKKIEDEMKNRVETRLAEFLQTIPKSPPAPETPPADNDDVNTVVTNLETNWRQLLVGRKHMLSAEPVAAEPPAATGASANTIETSRIVVHVVGEGEGPPSSTDSDGAHSVVLPIESPPPPNPSAQVRFD